MHCSFYQTFFTCKLSKNVPYRYVKICCGIFYICIYDVFYVVFIVLSCDYFVRNDEINEHIYIFNVICY